MLKENKNIRQGDTIKNLVNGTYNKEIEESVRKNIDDSFRIICVEKNDVDAMHDNAIFKGKDMDVFVKTGEYEFSYDQFSKEAWGLEYIKKNSPIYTPNIIDVFKVGKVAFLMMEAINVKPVESNNDWEILGRGLATLHKTTSNRCGLETHSYLGIFKQDNREMDTWPEFFAKRRIKDTMKMAVDAGNLSIEQCKLIEKLIIKIPKICGPKQPFSLLHGDPWPGNLLYDGEKMIIIDCGIYYGNREMDLSTVDFFYRVPEHFFGAYNEVYPIEPGYKDRKSLWQINQWLGHVTLFGDEYIPKLMNAVSKYV